MTGWIWLVACSADTPPGAAGAGPGAPVSDEEPAVPSSPSQEPAPGADEALARSVIDGTIGIEAGLAAIAWSGGLPVETASGSWIFLYDGGAGPWSVAGDFDDWTGTPLTQGAGGVWWGELAIEAPEGAGYKFTNGSDWLSDPVARSYTYDDFGELSYVQPPLDRFRLDRWPDFSAQGLAPRELRIYVPPGAGPFPVLYAQDAQNLFNPEAMWGGWRLQDALATVAPMIVVGLDNTVDRFDEYTHVPDNVGYGPMGGPGDLYADLVHDDLRPFVEATYGSNGTDGLMGSSLGGLISLHIAQRDPADWDFAASLSGTLGWGRFAYDERVMEELWLDQSPGFTHVYLDSGGSAGADGLCRDTDGDGFSEDDPDSDDNYCMNRQMADDLAAAGWTWDVNLTHLWEPDAAHNELAWAERVEIPLAIFAGQN